MVYIFHIKQIYILRNFRYCRCFLCSIINCAVAHKKDSSCTVIHLWLSIVTLKVQVVILLIKDKKAIDWF